MVGTAKAYDVAGIERVAVVDDVGRNRRHVLDRVAPGRTAFCIGGGIAAKEVGVVRHLQVRGTHSGREIRSGRGAGSLLDQDLQDCIGRQDSRNRSGGVHPVVIFDFLPAIGAKPLQSIIDVAQRIGPAVPYVRGAHQVFHFAVWVHEQGVDLLAAILDRSHPHGGIFGTLRYVGADSGARSKGLAVDVGSDVRAQDTLVDGKVNQLHAGLAQGGETGRDPARFGTYLLAHTGYLHAGIHVIDGLSVCSRDKVGEEAVSTAVGRAKRNDFQFGRGGPVGQVVIRYGGVVDIGFQLVGRLGRIGCILHVAVGLHFAAPHHAVGYHGGAVHVDAGTSAVAPSLDDDVRAGTFVAHHGAVVHLSALVNEDAAALGGRGVVRDHATGQGGVKAIVIIHALGRQAGATADAGGIVVNQAVQHLAVALHAHGSAISGHDTEAEALVRMQVAVVHFAAAVQVDGTAAAGSFIFPHDAVLQLRAVHHVDAAAKGVVLTLGVYRAVGCASTLDGKAVHQGSSAQSLGAAVFVEATGGKPHHVIGVAGEGGAVGLFLCIPFEGSGRGVRVVTRQDGLVLQFPRFGSAVLQHAVFREQGIAGLRTGITAVDADTGIQFKGGEEHAAANLFRTFGGYVGAVLAAVCHAGHVDDAALADALLRHVVVQVVDGILQVVAGILPRQSAVFIRAPQRRRLDVADERVLGLGHKDSQQE